MSARYNLDSCTVRVEPQMISELEHLNLPETLLKHFGIEAETTAGGLVLSGKSFRTLVPSGKLFWTLVLSDAIFGLLYFRVSNFGLLYSVPSH